MPMRRSVPYAGCAEQEQLRLHYRRRYQIATPATLCNRWRALSFSLVVPAAAKTSNALENSLEAVRQHLRLKRLAEKAGRPAGHRLFLDAGFGAGGDHDHRQRIMGRAEVPFYFETVSPGHLGVSYGA